MVEGEEIKIDLGSYFPLRKHVNPWRSRAITGRHRSPDKSASRRGADVFGRMYRSVGGAHGVNLKAVIVCWKEDVGLGGVFFVSIRLAGGGKQKKLVAICLRSPRKSKSNKYLS